MLNMVKESAMRLQLAMRIRSVSRLIRNWLMISSFLFLGICASSQERHSSPPPDQFAIGRHSFIDVGPPFDYYDLFIVRPASNGTSVERILLTPDGPRCSPPKIERASAAMTESIAELL